MTNPIKYSSNTFLTVWNDINADPELLDTEEWFKRLFAGSIDVIDAINNFVANERVLRTVITRQSVVDLLELIGYSLKPYSTSTGSLIFFLKPNTTFPLTVLKADLRAESAGSLTASSKRFEARSDEIVNEVTETFTVDTDEDTLTTAETYLTGFKVRLTTTDTLPAPLAIDTDYYTIVVDGTTLRLSESLENALAGTYIDITSTGSGTHTIKQLAFSVTAYQQKSVTDLTSIGTSDNTDWQEFDLPDTYILSQTLEVWINFELWTRVNNFVDYTDTDKVYQLIYKNDNTTAILFGGNGYGQVPGTFEIEIKYSYGGGAGSNILALNGIKNYAGANSSITGVTNSESFSGGSEEQSIVEAKRLGPLLLKTRERAITASDIDALTENFSGVISAHVDPNYYGLFTSRVVFVPAGGGLPSGALKTAVQDYLKSVSVNGAVDFRCEDIDYLVVDVTIQVKVLPGYTFANIYDYIDLAIKLFFTEQAKEIILFYQDNNLQSTIDFINNIFSTTFTVNNDGGQIQIILNELGTEPPVEFGQDVQQSDFIAFIEGAITGLDYFTITIPTFPIVLEEGQITQYGTVIITEIT